MTIAVSKLTNQTIQKLYNRHYSASHNLQNRNSIMLKPSRIYTHTLKNEAMIRTKTKLKEEKVTHSASSLLSCDSQSESNEIEDEDSNQEQLRSHGSRS